MDSRRIWDRFRFRDEALEIWRKVGQACVRDLHVSWSCSRRLHEAGNEGSPGGRRGAFGIGDHSWCWWSLAIRQFIEPCEAWRSPRRPDTSAPASWSRGFTCNLCNVQMSTRARLRPGLGTASLACQPDPPRALVRFSFVSLISAVSY